MIKTRKILPPKNKGKLFLTFMVLFPAFAFSQTIIRELVLDSLYETQKINTEPDKAYVHVRSQIPNLQFDSNRKIDKVTQKSSGDWDIWLPAGTHILKIGAKDYQMLDLPVFNYGKKKSYEIKITAKATYSIVTNPPGAHVKIDDTDTLTSPGKMNLQLGTHKIEISMSYYESIVYNINLTETGFIDEKKLFMVEASYTLLTEPSDADVTIDGHYIGKTPVETKLPLGEHKIVVAKSNWNEMSYRIILDENGLSDKKKLVGRIGIYRVITTPPSATVKIDGIDAGKTPIDLELGLGKHTVELTMPSYEGISYDIDLTENGLKDKKELTSYYSHELACGIGFGVPFEKEMFKAPIDIKASPDDGTMFRLFYLYNLTSSIAIGGHFDWYKQTISDFTLVQDGTTKKASFEFSPMCIGVEGRWTLSRGPIDKYCFLVMDSFSGELKGTAGDAAGKNVSGFNIGLGLGLKFRISEHYSGAAECLASYGSATWKNKVADNSTGVNYNSTFAAGYFTFGYEWGGH
jgi:hypothetical protein